MVNPRNIAGEREEEEEDQNRLLRDNQLLFSAVIGFALYRLELCSSDVLTTSDKREK